jgi:excinuclease ABC subunit B
VDLEFETAARLRDEVKRLRETELAIADDPLARQIDVEDKAGAFSGPRKYGAKANVLAGGRRAPTSPSPRPSRGEGRDEGQKLGTEQASAPHPNPLPVKDGERGSTRISTDYEPVQPTYAQSTTRIKKPSLDDMGPGTDRPVPARDRREGQPPSGGEQPVSETTSRVRKPTLDEMSSYASRPIPVDPRTKAGAFGEKIRGPHKPTYDEMGPHAERGLPIDGARPQKPTRTIDVPSGTEKKARRHGRPRKTGRPGH